MHLGFRGYCIEGHLKKSLQDPPCDILLDTGMSTHPVWVAPRVINRLPPLDAPVAKVQTANPNVSFSSSLIVKPYDAGFPDIVFGAAFFQEHEAMIDYVNNDFYLGGLTQTFHTKIYFPSLPAT